MPQPTRQNRTTPKNSKNKDNAGQSEWWWSLLLLSSHLAAAAGCLWSSASMYCQAVEEMRASFVGSREGFNISAASEKVESRP
jgi:hypothetical protein